jgi:hypothetical protein
MIPFTATKEASSILRLPAGRRVEIMNKLSANANAPGGCKRQTNGRASRAMSSRLASTQGVYLIETTKTGTLAYNVGGQFPATITIENGTPGTTAIASNELDPITWAGAGTNSFTVQDGTVLLGNAKVAIS